MIQAEGAVPQLMRCYTGYPLGAYVVQKYKTTLTLDGHIALPGVGSRVGDKEKVVGVVVEVIGTLEGAYDLIHVRGVAAQKGIVGIGEGYIAR